jgi:putative flavoprotein involved in K+ transport
MKKTDTVIIGGGQAGLAMSRALSDRGVDHVVLERGRVAERWRSERWDSLRLLTPNWQSRLPGYRYRGAEPDGFMTMPEVIDYLEGYARSFSAPVEHATTVSKVERVDDAYRVATDRGTWRAANVVVATGYSDVPFVPELGAKISKEVLQLVPSRYRNPGQLPPGRVLVVGASASGIQLADEIHASGRPVTLSVGRHIRLPRRYRGKDSLWWLDVMGLLDETVESVYDIEASRNQPSLQLVGRPDHHSVNLIDLQERGVRLAGRTVDADGFRVSFDDDLVAHTAAADAKLASLLVRIDEFVERRELAASVGEAEPFVPFFWPATAPESIDLRREGISTVLWATGFRRRYPWLHVPALDRRGEIRHRGGVTDIPGLYVLGLQFQRRRKSAFLDGVGPDALELAAHIATRLGCARHAVA